MANESKHRSISRCPICRRPAQPTSRPFCSPHCAQVDLGRWLTGGYAIPGKSEATQDNDDEDA